MKNHKEQNKYFGESSENKKMDQCNKKDKSCEPSKNNEYGHNKTKDTKNNKNTHSNGYNHMHDEYKQSSQSEREKMNRYKSPTDSDCKSTDDDCKPCKPCK
jgi:hypothetical protein